MTNHSAFRYFALNDIALNNIEFNDLTCNSQEQNYTTSRLIIERLRSQAKLFFRECFNFIVTSINGIDRHKTSERFDLTGINFAIQKERIEK